MDYSAETGVWEITMGCNMSCKHCGSSCKKALPDELTTKEALKLTEEICALGLGWITLSGGEPLLRKDWHLIAAKLAEGNVIPNIITNGWLLTDTMLDKAVAARVGTIAISLDGLQETHDHIRQPGSYKRVISGLKKMHKRGIHSGVITTVTKDNVHELPRIRDILMSIGVPSWQLQIGLPMGNFHENRQMIMEPAGIDQIIDYCYEATKMGGITVFPADCVGYYNLKELEVRKITYQTEGFPLWQGCNAGKRSLGILHNGNILGCTSIRDKSFIEGNIRERPLAEIWNDPKSFLWNRNATKQELTGTCHICQYGSACLGGCPNTRLTMNKNLHSENQYCSYNVGMSRAKEQLQKNQPSQEELLSTGRELLEQGEFQLGVLTFQHLLETAPDHLDALRYLGFGHFFLENYDECIRYNRMILEQDNADVYANKGMGLALHRLGQSEAGITFLQKAVAKTAKEYMDPYFDLAVVYLETNRRQEALELIAQGKSLSATFATQIREVEMRLN